MMDLHQLKETYSQTIADMKAMQQTLKDIAISIGYLQQGDEAKPSIIRNSKAQGDTKWGNPNCPKKRRSTSNGKGKGFNNSSQCWWCKGNVSHDKVQHRIQDCHLYKQCKEKYWKEHPTNKVETAPNPSKFILHIETINKTEGFKAVLYQIQNGVKRVIVYASRSLNKSEMNYPVHKLEFLALKWAVTDKFHDYLYGGNTFEVYTDNNPLTYVLSTAKLDACSHRWVARLANYNFNIHYRSGITNVDADALSRIQWPNILSDPDIVDFYESISTQSVKAICSSSISYGYCETMCGGAASLLSQFIDMSVSSSQPFDWSKEQNKCPEIKEIVGLIKKHRLYSRKLKKGDSSITKALLRIKGQLKVIKNVLYRKTILETKDEKKPRLQLILPGHLTTKVLNGLHNQVGHQGIVRTLGLLRERFYWPGMHRDATHYVNKCQNCLKRKATPDVAPLQPIIANQPMELVHMDFLSIEPSKGNIENVLVITDHFTRYAQAYPSKTQTAQATAKLLWENVY